MALIKCDECGAEISNRAAACPKCGNPISSIASAQKDAFPAAIIEPRPPAAPKKKRTAIRVAGVAMLAVIAYGIYSSTQSSPQSSQIASTATDVQPQTEATPVSPPPPSRQEVFERARTDLFDSYDKAPNEIQASAIFNQANARVDGLVRENGTGIVNWTGVIDDLITSHGGTDVHVTIQSSDNVTYRIDSDAASGSTIYNELANLRKGQKVFFSGVLVGERGHWERSLTERGSLDNPTFDVMFSYIGASPEVSAPPPTVRMQSPPATESPTNVATFVQTAPGPADAPATLPQTYATSFDCTKARSDSEHLICGDAELAGLDRELGGIYARAKEATRDPVAFKEQTRQNWNYRERQCHDKACLLSWYVDQKARLEHVADTGDE